MLFVCLRSFCRWVGLLACTSILLLGWGLGVWLGFRFGLLVGVGLGVVCGVMRVWGLDDFFTGGVLGVLGWFGVLGFEGWWAWCVGFSGVGFEYSWVCWVCFVILGVLEVGGFVLWLVRWVLLLFFGVWFIGSGLDGVAFATGHSFFLCIAMVALRSSSVTPFLFGVLFVWAVLWVVCYLLWRVGLGRRLLI